MLFSIVTTPLVLRWLGQERMGAFRTSVDWTGYIGFLELGLSGALSSMFAESISVGDKQRTQRIMAVGLKAYRWATLLMAVACCAFVFAAPSLVRVRPALTADLRWGVMISCVSLLFVPLAPLRTFLEGGQRGYIINVALALQSITVFALSVLFAWTQQGIRGQWLALIAGMAVNNVLIFCYVWRELRSLPALLIDLRAQPLLSPLPPKEGLTPIEGAAGLGVTEIEPEAQLWKLNGATFAITLCTRLSYYTDNILIALFLGPAVVVPFLLTQRLAQIIQAQIGSIGNATWAALAELYATGQHELFGRRAIQLSQLIMVGGLAGMLPYLAFGRSFVIRWVGVEQYAGMTLMLLAAANGLLLSLVGFWSSLFSGTQKVAVLILPVLAGAIVNFAGSVIATKLYGRTGPLWGTFISFFVIYLWWMPLLLKRTFSISIRELAIRILQPLLLAIAYGTPLIWIAQRHSPHTWPSIMLLMFCSGCGYLALVSFTILDPEQRQLIRERFVRRSGVQSISPR